MVTISESFCFDIVPKILHSREIEINTAIIHTSQKRNDQI